MCGQRFAPSHCTHGVRLGRPNRSRPHEPRGLLLHTFGTPLGPWAAAADASADSLAYDVDAPLPLHLCRYWVCGEFASEGPLDLEVVKVPSVPFSCPLLGDFAGYESWFQLTLAM